MDSEALDKLPVKAIELAIAAGEAIIQVYNSPFSVEYKEDNSPLTLADKLSHEIISSGLKKYSTYPVLSEEMAETPYEERKNWKTFWLVDPLDGTKEFIKRNGEFTVNIALIEGTKAVMGFIYLPVNKVLYYAIKGKGAYRVAHLPSKKGEEIIKAAEKLPLAKTAKQDFTIVASRSHNSPETEAFINEQKGKHGAVSIVSAGSSIKFCLVAEGTADAYPRYAPTMEWDSAAGQAIVEEAGKKVTLSDGKTPLAYNKQSLVNPHFLVI
jgi:3'(2'), 5'-bisphosphate nucleotidase